MNKPYSRPSHKRSILNIGALAVLVIVITTALMSLVNYYYEYYRFPSISDSGWTSYKSQELLFEIEYPSYWYFIDSGDKGFHNFENERIRFWDVSSVVSLHQRNTRIPNLDATIKWGNEQILEQFPGAVIQSSEFIKYGNHNYFTASYEMDDLLIKEAYIARTQDEIIIRLVTKKTAQIYGTTVFNRVVANFSE